MTSPPRPDELDPEERAWISFISPHFVRKDIGPEPPTEEHMVLLFSDRVWGWQLDVADRLAKSGEHAGYAVLGIVMSYFEMIGKHLRGFEGTGQSEVHFRVGFDSVFADLPKVARDRIADRLYKGVRNGMYHDAITSSGIALAGESEGRILYETPGVDGIREVIINPELLTSRIRRHFAAYVAELLRDPESEKRRAFVTRFLWVDTAGQADARAGESELPVSAPRER